MSPFLISITLSVEVSPFHPLSYLLLLLLLLPPKQQGKGGKQVATTLSALTLCSPSYPTPTPSSYPAHTPFKTTFLQFSFKNPNPRLSTQRAIHVRPIAVVSVPEKIEKLAVIFKISDFHHFSTDFNRQRAIAKYLSQDLPYQLPPDDVYGTAGCTQAIEVVVSALARPGANILLPKPGYPQYEARAAFDYLQVRHFNPESDWEVDLDSGEALAEDNTTAIVIINPSYPCGNVFKIPAFEEATCFGIMQFRFDMNLSPFFGINNF
ncbi:hypothetical protein FEM48_ZijujUnG0115800 [Ziziphus jujuba var. spinosa]|uniref:Aminotransferase class I/classII large domain-containing protein n=1 Tax=Ziziphus jujuba var. spinosa TaxID=714518 RepID=A0A978U7Y1_ZIZJJ|nr:hypothetical protein FEM48_ZijujUnG0115800 [Ziziphus jujuba var. spinosa]